MSVVDCTLPTDGERGSHHHHSDNGQVCWEDDGCDGALSTVTGCVTVADRLRAYCSMRSHHNCVGPVIENLVKERVRRGKVERYGLPCARPERHNTDDLHYTAGTSLIDIVNADSARPDMTRMLADVVEWREQITPITLILDRIETALRYANIETRGHLIILLPPGMLPTVTHMYGYTVRRLDGIDTPTIGYLP